MTCFNNFSKVLDYKNLAAYEDREVTEAEGRDAVKLARRFLEWAQSRLADATMPVFARGLFFAGLAASIFAALQAKSLLAAVSLGRDFCGRLLPAGTETSQRRVRLALIAAAALSFALARLLPSVVDLWYAVGSAVIPGLLLPMLGVYIPRLRIKGSWAAAASFSGFIASLGWVIAARRLGAPPLGLEPPFPGLFLSTLIWVIGRVTRAPSPHVARFLICPI